MSETAQLSKMTKGWFIGDFSPSLFKTDQFEVAVKYYKAGDKEAEHHHKVGTEYTVVVSGEVLMNSKKYKSGDIVIYKPGEPATFEALTDSVTTVVKIPSVCGDKYPGKP